MPKHDKMPKTELLPYLRRMQKRYKEQDKAGRGVLLTEMNLMTKLTRKTLIRRMNSSLEQPRRRRERGRTYGAAVDDALRVIAESWDYITVERLTPNLVSMAETLAKHGELRITPELLEQLGKISSSTVGRIMRRLRQDEPRLPRAGPQEANRLRKQVPMTRIAWNEQQPGHFETDLVYHSGPNAGGEYMHTVQLIDVATGWSERYAVLGRSYRVMVDAFERILARLPFAVIELHPDNGSEFFNNHMLRFWHTAIPSLKLSRSRPWQKNDNRFVEQKNDTLVRAYLGHKRLDTVAQTKAVNALYQDMWIYYNFFQPVMRLKAKVVTHDAQGKAHTKKRYDQASTPFERLCRTGILSQSEIERLVAWRDAINPRQLHRSIERQLSHIMQLPGAKAGISEDVFATLTSPIPA